MYVLMVGVHDQVTEAQTGFQFVFDPTAAITQNQVTKLMAVLTDTIAQVKQQAAARTPLPVVQPPSL